MKKPKLRELGEAIKALIKGPYTTKFPFAPSPADPSYRGKVEFDDKECVGCGACAEVCPARAIEMVDDVNSGKRRMVHHYDICIFCGQCNANCLTKKGINLTQEYDLAFLKDRDKQITSVEKNLVFCESCGEVITTIEHLRFLAKKLGPLAYSNTNLILVDQEELGLIEKPAPKEEVPHKRANLMKILCGKCRRQVVIKEEWGEIK
jgi:hydrogenase-4 component H